MNKEQLDELVKRAAEKVYSPVFVIPIVLCSIVLAIYLVPFLNLPPVFELIMVLISSYAITVVMFSTVIAVVMRVIQDEVIEEEDDDDGIQAMPVMMTIVSNSESIGKFKDRDIFKWIDMATEDGNVTRFEFLGTIRHGEDMNWLPVGSVILEPGIIYTTQQNESQN